MSASLGSRLVEVSRNVRDLYQFLTRIAGFSFKTNEYGLTIDTVKGFELVLSNGTATNVTESTNPDLFFALKVSQHITLEAGSADCFVQGGFNNFVGNSPSNSDVNS